MAFYLEGFPVFGTALAHVACAAAAALDEGARVVHGQGSSGLRRAGALIIIIVHAAELIILVLIIIINGRIHIETGDLCMVRIVFQCLAAAHRLHVQVPVVLLVMRATAAAFLLVVDRRVLHLLRRIALSRPGPLLIPRHVRGSITG